jgi:ABC-type Fe3+/spermidine/putrescine transport system ATPase subunit
VTDPTATPAQGDPVTVAARPERLEAVPADGPSPNIDGWTSVPGRIHQGTYLGDQTEFRVQTDLAGELVVRRQNATGTGTSQGMGPGDPVVVRWLDAANLVLLA